LTEPAPAGGTAGPADLVQPFQIEASRLRGRLVRLGPVVESVLGRHAYPEPVGSLLAEMLTLAALLASALKYDGVFTLQAKGDGPVRLMVADVTSGGDMRGFAQFDPARLGGLDASASVPRTLGAGYLAFTVDQGTRTDRYQGIVELVGASLVDCVHHYFRQSEQIEAGIKLAVAGGVRRERWRAGALMLQRLPGAAGDEAAEDDWRHALALMASATAAELVGGDLSMHDLLYRLFHEQGVRVYAPVALRAGCRCSRERVETVLRALPAGELESAVVDGHVIVTCEFCNASYRFLPSEIGRKPS
jgi:molecular chaperone Hsp33